MGDVPPLTPRPSCGDGMRRRTRLLQTKRPRDVQPSEVVTANLDERMTMTTHITTACNWGDERLPERFWSKCTPEPNSGCWLWLASVDVWGYGRISWRGMNRAHRVSYTALVGE